MVGQYFYITAITTGKLYFRNCRGFVAINYRIKNKGEGKKQTEKLFKLTPKILEGSIRLNEHNEL